MKLPDDAVILEEKLTKYLLLPRPWDDKAKFLAQAGFTQANSGDLMFALRLLATTAEIIEDGTNDYGGFYRAEGDLVGPQGRTLTIITIWLRRHVDGSFQFVTLKPWRGPRS